VKMVMKWILVVLGVLLLTMLATVGAVFVGWIPVPGWVVSSVAPVNVALPPQSELG
jgi:hypothetical protein